MQNQPALPQVTLRRMMDGFRLSQTLYVAAKLGLADLLRDGPKAYGELAQATETHPRSLYRLLRALSSAGIFEELENGCFALNALAEPLRSDSPVSLRGWMVFSGNQIYPTWGGLLHSVKTGETAFQHMYGMSDWDYYALHPEVGQEFNEAMSSNVGSAAREVVATYDFSSFGCVVDVGGGQGALMTMILQANPSLRGVIFDLPHVVEGAERGLVAAGLRDRCQLVAGSFFDAVPPGADAYILKQVIHDWNDEQARQILESCRRAAQLGGTLLIVERALDARNPHPDATTADLNMLVRTGGQERTDAEYAALLTSSGFELRRAIPTSSGMGLHILEATAV